MNNHVQLILTATLWHLQIAEYSHNLCAMYLLYSRLHRWEISLNENLVLAI